jgi:hypothetical protein
MIMVYRRKGADSVRRKLFRMMKDTWKGTFVGATQVDAFGAMRRTSLQIPIILGSNSVAGLAQERTTTVKILRAATFWKAC